MDKEPDLIMSKKCQAISNGGETVYVEIYRLEDEKRWVLAIDDEFGNTSIFDNTFKSEKGALLQAKKSILEDGIDSFIQPDTAKNEHNIFQIE